MLGFKSFTDPQLVTTGGGVVKEMKDNPNFPNPPEELKTLESAVEELSAALAAQVQGGTAATAHKNNKRDAVIELLVKLAHYVQDNCGQNPATLLSSGFQLATNNRAKSPVEKAAILSDSGGQKLGHFVGVNGTTDVVGLWNSARQCMPATKAKLG